MAKHNAAVISERRQKLWTLLTRGLKTYEIAKELGTDHSTISRDLAYLKIEVQELDSRIITNNNNIKFKMNR